MTPKHPSAHKPGTGVSMKIPFPGEEAAGNATLHPLPPPPKLGAAQWVHMGAFQQHLGGCESSESLERTVSSGGDAGGRESVTSLCHEGELAAIEGLMELVGACEEHQAEGRDRGSGGGSSSNNNNHNNNNNNNNNSSSSNGGSSTRSAPPKGTTTRAPSKRSSNKLAAAGGAGGAGEVRGSGGGGGGGVGGGEGGGGGRRGQSFRGVTWDKMKKMWR